jgi:predicted alpha/beta hydrolase family esterase
MPTFITLPGIDGSDESHWQTRWEHSQPSMQRFHPSDWEKPQLHEWCGALQDAVDAADDPIILVAHSLSYLLVAHWAAKSNSAIAGAFLVAVPDPDSSAFPAAASSFRPVPTGAPRFPSLIVASTDDPYGTLEYVQSCAEEWQSELVSVGAFGHINASSNLGEWPEGKSLLNNFVRSFGFDGA